MQHPQFMSLGSQGAPQMQAHNYTSFSQFMHHQNSHFDNS
jgi:hypothetical protein